MLLLNKAKNIFRNLIVNDTSIVTSETAAVQSLLMMGIDWPQYNPDDLIVRKGHKIYTKMMVDEQVKAVTRFRRDATTGREWFFEIDEDISETEKERRIGIFNAIVKQVNGSWKAKLDMIMAAMYQGFSITSKVFGQIQHDGKTYWGIKSIKKKPYETFYFYLDDFGTLLKMVQRVDEIEKTLNINNFIHHVQNPDVDEFYGRSELREAYRAYFSKDIAYRLWNMFLERYATGFVVGKPQKNKTFREGTQEWTDFKNVLESIRFSTAIIPPGGVDIEVHQFKDTEAYEKAINQHDKAIAKALLMPNMLGLSEVGPNGSRALGDTQLEAFLWMLDAEMLSLEETLNEQLFMPLGKANFADGVYPKYKFKPLSDSAIQKIIVTWKDLVEGGAVEHTEADETHVRNLLEFPQKPEKDDDEASTSVNPNTALSGGQVTSLLEIIDKVVNGTLPRDTGVNIIVTSFPVSEEEADTIMGEVGKGFKPEVPVALPGTDGNGNPIQPGPPDSPRKAGQDEPKPPVIPVNQPKQDETISGNSLLQIAYTRALRRVDFTTINRVSTKEGEIALKTMSEAVAKGVEVVANSLEKNGLGSMQDLKTILLPASTRRELKKASTKLLNASWKLGRKQAKKEIERAKKEKFSKDFKSLQDDVVGYIKNKSFEMAGKVSAKGQDIIWHEVSQGIKYSKSTKQTIESIYKSLAKNGLISLDKSPKKWLAQALDYTNPTARLETIIRTNTFDIVNEARFDYFTDDELDDFVEAFQYSAILDSRTTTICEELDNNIYVKDSPEWNKYRPPNHFNCRSLLVPVTELDVWEASESPKLEPQDGFE